MMPRLPFTECFGHGLGYFGFCLDHFGACFLSFRLHFLLCWLRPLHGVPLLWPEQCSYRHWPGLSARPHRYSYLYRDQQCQWTGFRMLFRHPTLCGIPVWRLNPGSPILTCDFRTNRWKIQIPSPTPAGIVLSRAPPTNWRILARTVTRACNQLDTIFCYGGHWRGINHLGVNGHLERLRTRHGRARSIAVAIWNGSSILALEADTRRVPLLLRVHTSQVSELPAGRG